MNVLITSSRAPVALELIRAFGRAGHRVYATDTLPLTLGSASRYLAGHMRTPPPRQEPAAFQHVLIDIIKQYQIDLLLPTCEEVFAIGAAYADLAAWTRVYTVPLGLLDRLHHKGRFQALAAGLDLRTPRTVVVRSQVELQSALADFPHYLLKPAYSRFAGRIISNCGPWAGQSRPADCRPSPQQPWLVQEYIDGELICSYSLLQRGRLNAHCAYRAPYKAGYGSGIYFRSIAEPASRAAAAAIAGALAYSGQLSLDFIRSQNVLYLIECNPRTTSAVHLMDGAALAAAMCDPDYQAPPVPAGRNRQLFPLTLAGALRRSADRRSLLRDMPRAHDVIFAADDPAPALAQFAMTAMFAAQALRRGITITEATTHDIEWNG
jgi:hypothetical protein